MLRAAPSAKSDHGRLRDDWSVEPSRDFRRRVTVESRVVCPPLISVTVVTIVTVVIIRDRADAKIRKMSET